MEFVNVNEKNREIVNDFIVSHWGSTKMILRGEVVDMTKTSGILLIENNDIVGLITYIFYGDTCEITSLDSLEENIGIGSKLIERLVEIAIDKGCTKIVLITTNDNINAFGFYQKRGFDLVAVNFNALDKSRELKPSIPLIGENNIPLKHELEFQLKL